ncbi:sigma-54-dependent Fis family transcriptional regulator [Acidisoma cladoniae]|uniref:sigma-54-dependent Fis family transcriptional regulator n=1 Tax=Acidisoma cladoniae TaxID=3040935 RepID=UPI002549C2B0|nr:sigma-54-dependent Fis family transcriptional regulator [Acidisoma sp. PAMC 29798]
MLISSEDRLARARTVLERRHVTPADLLSAEISASWTRCLEHGLDPENPPPPRRIEAPALRRARDAAGAMRPLVLAEMENLYHQIAGSNFMIAFALADGLLLDTIADTSFNTTADTTRIQPGCLWSELGCGTNALGSVAATQRPMTIHGGEHFFRRYGQLTCTAAPVFGPDGALAGVLDASSDCQSRQQHTRALVSMAATQIENGLFRDFHRKDIVVAFHNRAEYLHTLSAGLMAFDPSGVILGANPQARLFLQGLPAIPGRRFEGVFRMAFSAFIEAGRHDPRMRLQDRVGSVFVAHLETLRAAPVALAKPVAPPKPVAVDGFVAADPVVATAMRQVEAAARRGLPILIRGETGTGKEQLARHAHAASGRTGAFVPVNCAALPESLVEAELFGHAEGAFTGARRGGAAGLVVQAHGGTLFLDEIGDMPLALQAVLLRLLDDWMVRPVGGGATRRVEVLLVAATNADLAQEVAKGRFRADLYYRLDTIEALLPPLRARTDFDAILRHLLAVISPEAAIEPAAIDRLAAHSWPGNIRELRNALTRLTLIDSGRPVGPSAVESLLGAGSPAGPREVTLRDETTARILKAHRETEGNLSAAARRLGVSRNRVYRALASQGRKSQ